jgi:hypothetical protein
LRTDTALLAFWTLHPCIDREHNIKKKGDGVP